jgi:hypothetical protein
MDTQLSNDYIDLDLVDKVLALVPEQAWSLVLTAIVSGIVDEMPSTVLQELTGDVEGFDRAEEILTSYYNGTDQHNALIQDAFKLIGTENTLHLLDAMQLNKYVESLELNTETND